MELAEALMKGRFGEAMEEAQQVAFDLQHLVHQSTGMDFEPRGCAGFVSGLYLRIEEWKRIFALNGLDGAFHPRHLRGGSNHRRPEKVEAALRSARAELGL